MDIEQTQELETYLRNTGRITPTEPVHIKVLVGGVSNQTVLVERPGGENWVLKQALAKLRVKVDWFSDPQRIQNEARGLQWLAQLAPLGTITPLIFEDYENNLLAMQAVSQPHQNWKSMLLQGQLKPDHVKQFGQLLATIHRRSWESREKLSDLFGDRSFFTSLRIEPYYSYTATRVPEAKTFLADLTEATYNSRFSLVHGDYSPKNILVYQDKLVLLDHEVIHWGDPAFDLGFSLTHLLSKAHHLSDHRRSFMEAANYYWQTYSAALGNLEWRAKLEQRTVQHTLGCLLARVAGRSPLEYLDETERDRQQAVVLALIDEVPATLPALFKQFARRL